MRLFLKVILISILSGVLISCNPTVKPEELPSSIGIGKIYYSQVAMHMEHGRFPATNYGVGDLLPVNSRVKIIEVKKKYFTGEDVSTHRELKFSNDPDHTHDTIIQAFDKIFGPEPIDLSKFDALEQENIKEGRVEKGMGKAAVLVARGYPPAIGTPSLESNQWKYWWNRWNNFLVKFENDRVVKVTRVGPAS